MGMARGTRIETQELHGLMDDLARWWEARRAVREALARKKTTNAVLNQSVQADHRLYDRVERLVQIGAIGPSATLN